MMFGRAASVFVRASDSSAAARRALSPSPCTCTWMTRGWSLTSTRSSTLSTSGSGAIPVTIAPPRPVRGASTRRCCLDLLVSHLTEPALGAGKAGLALSELYNIIPADLALRAPDSGRGSHRAPVRQLAGASLGWKVSQLNRPSPGYTETKADSNRPNRVCRSI